MADAIRLNDLLESPEGPSSYLLPEHLSHQDSKIAIYETRCQGLMYICGIEYIDSESDRLAGFRSAKKTIMTIPDAAISAVRLAITGSGIRSISIGGSAWSSGLPEDLYCFEGIRSKVDNQRLTVSMDVRYAWNRKMCVKANLTLGTKDTRHDLVFVYCSHERHR